MGCSGSPAFRRLTTPTYPSRFNCSRSSSAGWSPTVIVAVIGRLTFITLLPNRFGCAGPSCDRQSRGHRPTHPLVPDLEVNPTGLHRQVIRPDPMPAPWEVELDGPVSWGHNTYRSVGIETSI